MSRLRCIVYASQSEDACGRTWRKQAKLEARVGANWTRPKGMHRATRERLMDGNFDCEGRREDELAAFIGRMDLRHPGLLDAFR